MISMYTSSIPQDDVSLRLLYCNSRCLQPFRQGSDTCCRRSEIWCWCIIKWHQCPVNCCWWFETCHQWLETSCWRSKAYSRYTQTLWGLSSELSGLTPAFPRSPMGMERSFRQIKCSQRNHHHFHGTSVSDNRDLSYSEGLSECTCRVWYSHEIDASKFTLHILSDTPGGSQRLTYILLMIIWIEFDIYVLNIWSICSKLFSAYHSMYFSSINS